MNIVSSKKEWSFVVDYAILIIASLAVSSSIYPFEISVLSIGWSIRMLTKLISPQKEYEIHEWQSKWLIICLIMCVSSGLINYLYTGGHWIEKMPLGISVILLIIAFYKSQNRGGKGMLSLRRHVIPRQQNIPS